MPAPPRYKEIIKRLKRLLETERRNLRQVKKSVRSTDCFDKLSGWILPLVSTRPAHRRTAERHRKLGQASK